MYHAVHFDGEALMCDRQQYLQKHTVVYESPAYEGCDGMPIGNGDMGGMLYHAEDRILFGLNKTDMIDYGPDGNFDAWSWESEECNTAPVSCGTLSFSDGMPSFDRLYLKDFRQELSIADGTVTGSAETPFSSTKWRSFVSAPYGVFVLELDSRSQEPVRRTITLEKWGSVNLFHDYEQVKPMPEKNLFCVSGQIRGSTLYLTQQVRGSQCVLALRVAGCECAPELCNSRTLQLTFPRSTGIRVTVLAACVTSHDGSETWQAAGEILDRAERELTQLYPAQKETWKAFWEKSFLCLPEDDYLENIYYINLYQLGSSSLGTQPLTFAGLWSWYKDTRNWGHFYHWNHQQTYWSMYASNHRELARNYLDYRFRMVENGRSDARKLFGCRDGLYYSDVANFNGFNALEPDTVRNLTPSGQIAMDFYRDYCYSGDTEFLKQKAYPVMKMAANLYCSLLQKEPDGVYRIRGGSTCYESYWNMKETVTDYGAIHVLFQALLDTAELTGLPSQDARQYREILDQLYALPLTDSRYGPVLATGRKWNGEPTKIAEGDYPWAPFNLCELSLVYPSGYIGLEKRGTELFEIARRTARVLFDMDVYHKSKIGSSGHAIAPEAAARLGMREDCLRILHHYVKTYQQFPNGLTHFADRAAGQYWSSQFRSRVIPRDVSGTQWEDVHEKTTGKRQILDSRHLSHCYFEPISNVAAGLQEMLLQSCGRVIRVFPATPEAYSAMFTLSAEGGFQVTSELAKGEIRYVSILSTRGGECRVELPWQEPVQIHSGFRDRSFRLEDGCAVFDTVAGERYTLTRLEKPLEQYYKSQVMSQPNAAPKQWQGNVLGILRMIL